MSDDNRKLLEAALRDRLDYFVERVFRTLNPGEAFERNWHIQAICHALVKVYRGETQRLIITMPPRNLKSITTSIAFCAWALGHDPSLRFLVASYGQDLAGKLARDFRSIAEAPWFRSAFPRFRIDPRKNTEGELMTTLRGGRKAVTVGGPATGFGADILIVDDLLKAAEFSSPAAREAANDHYDNTLFSRLDDKGKGRIIVIQQRLHEDDLVGHLLEKGGWVHLNLPAIAAQDEVFDLADGSRHIRRMGDVLFPQREPRDVLAEIERGIGAMNFSAQYLQDPTPPGGNWVKWEWFRPHEPGRPREAYRMIVQSWDTASAAGPENDYSVCITAGYRDSGWDLLDIVRRRCEYPELRGLVVAQLRRWRADKVLVEHAGSGISLVAELHRIHPQIRRYNPLQGKEARLNAVSGLLSDGVVRVPHAAPWLTDFRRELLAFPSGKHDDQVDALSQFLEWARHPRVKSYIDQPPRRGGRPGDGTPRRRRISLHEHIRAFYDRDVPSLYVPPHRG